MFFFYKKEVYQTQVSRFRKPNRPVTENFTKEKNNNEQMHNILKATRKTLLPVENKLETIKMIHCTWKVPKTVPAGVINEYRIKNME